MTSTPTGTSTLTPCWSYSNSINIDQIIAVPVIALNRLQVSTCKLRILTTFSVDHIQIWYPTDTQVSTLLRPTLVTTQSETKYRCSNLTVKERISQEWIVLDLVASSIPGTRCLSRSTIPIHSRIRSSITPSQRWKSETQKSTGDSITLPCCKCGKRNTLIGNFDVRNSDIHSSKVTSQIFSITVSNIEVHIVHLLEFVTAATSFLGHVISCSEATCIS